MSQSRATDLQVNPTRQPPFPTSDASHKYQVPKGPTAYLSTFQGLYGLTRALEELSEPRQTLTYVHQFIKGYDKGHR